MALFLPVALLCIILLWLTHARISRRLRLIRLVDKLPGPLSVPILGTTWQLKWDMKELVEQLRNWAVEYTEAGEGLIRLWLGTRPLIIVFRDDYAKAVLESNSLLVKGPEYGILKPWLGTGLLIADGEKWRRRRKMLTPAFHFDVLKEFVEVFDAQAQILVGVLEKNIKDGKEIDAFPFIKRCALDIICETAMGCSVDAQNQTTHSYVTSVKRLNELAFLYQRMPWMWIEPVWRLSPYSKEYDFHLHNVKTFTLDVIQKRRKELHQEEGEVLWEERKRKAFLDLLIGMEKEHSLTDEDIREEVDTFMFEGHDTTAVAMGWVLWCVAHHPEVQQKIFNEVDDVFGDSSRSCTPADLSQLKYLEKVVKEALRLFPSVPNIARFVHEDTVVNGTLIPQGCTIIVSPSVLHHNPKLFPDALVFDPENFSEERVTERKPFSFIPFSAGPRNCIGQRFAMMEEKAVLSWFFRRFAVSSEIPFLENLACPEITNKPLFGFPLHVQARVSSHHGVP